MEQTLGKRIVAHRKRMGLTQDQLAEQLGVTAQAVSKWENDQSCPDITMLPKLAERFGISVDALLGCDEPAKEAEVVTECSTSRVYDGEDDEDEDEESDGNSTWEVNWDSGRKSGLLFAVMLVWVGTLTLISRLFGWEDASFWDILWPSALMFWGIGVLLKQFSIFGTVLTVSGLFFLVDNLNILTIDFGLEYLLPIALLICGVGLLLDALRKPKKGGFRVMHNGREVNSKTSFSTHGETFVCSVFFGERNNQVCLDRLSHGAVTVSFGEAKVDLSGCREIAPDCTIDVSCS